MRCLPRVCIACIIDSRLVCKQIVDKRNSAPLNDLEVVARMQVDKRDALSTNETIL